MILVTGAAGRLARRVVVCLAERGYDVLGTDREPCNEASLSFVQADLCDVSRVMELASGVEAIIHMGAIPGPGLDEYKTFGNNVQSTFNVLEAAAYYKIPRVVFSSSALVMGFAHDPLVFVPRYLPLDEEHPVAPFESYGLSKEVGECIGRMVARTTATSVVSLRFANVVTPEQQAEFPWPAPSPENPTTLVMWAYADPRDIAAAHVRALEADLSGHETFLLAQPSTRFRESTVELIQRNFGDQLEIRGELSGNASVINTEKARRLLGFVPQWDWNS